jgi:hypothetical protein
MAALTSSVTMGARAPVVGVKQTRSVRAAAMPRASLKSSFTATGYGKSIDGQRLSMGVEASAGGKRGGSRCVTTMAAKIAGYIKLAIEAGKVRASFAQSSFFARGIRLKWKRLLFYFCGRNGSVRGRAALRV